MKRKGVTTERLPTMDFLGKLQKVGAPQDYTPEGIVTITIEAPVPLLSTLHLLEGKPVYIRMMGVSEDGT